MVISFTVNLLILNFPPFSSIKYPLFLVYEEGKSEIFSVAYAFISFLYIPLFSSLSFWESVSRPQNLSFECDFISHFNFWNVNLNITLISFSFFPAALCAWPAPPVFSLPTHCPFFPAISPTTAKFYLKMQTKNPGPYRGTSKGAGKHAF